MVPSKDVLASDADQAGQPGSSADLCYYLTVHGNLLVGADPPPLWLPTHNTGCGFWAIDWGESALS
eukprot:12917307-Prorocentrum_lima.AAC.1